MILDNDGTSCSKVNIGLGNGAGTTAREWDIKVNKALVIGRTPTFFHIWNEMS